MVFRNRRRGVSFLIAGVVLAAMGYFSLGEVQDPTEPADTDGGIGFFVFGTILSLIGVSGLFARIEINTEGLHRRSWFALVRRSYAWDSINSWTVGQVSKLAEESAGSWFVEFEIAGEIHPNWIWINEGEVDLPELFKIAKDVRTHAAAKERLSEHFTTMPSS